MIEFINFLRNHQSFAEFRNQRHKKRVEMLLTLRLYADVRRDTTAISRSESGVESGGIDPIQCIFTTEFELRSVQTGNRCYATGKNGSTKAHLAA